MKEYNQNEFNDKQNKFKPKFIDEGLIEDYTLENDFEPMDENKLNEDISEIEFEPRDENEHKPIKKTKRDKSHYDNVRKKLNDFFDLILKG